MKRKITKLVVTVVVFLCCDVHLVQGQKSSCRFELDHTRNWTSQVWHENSSYYTPTKSYCFNLKVHLVNNFNGQSVNQNMVTQAINGAIPLYAAGGINLNWDGTIQPAFNSSALNNDPVNANNYINNDANFIDIYFFNTSGFGGSFAFTDESIIGMDKDQVNFHTVAHEIGHTLGLLHTFHGRNGETDSYDILEDPGYPSNGREAGDFVYDTPADNGSSASGQLPDCDIVDDTNGNLTFFPDPKNIMSYNLNCRDELTSGQFRRIKYYINFDLLDHVNAALACSTPVGGFTCDNLENLVSIALDEYIDYNADCTGATISCTSEPGFCDNYSIKFTWNDGDYGWLSPGNNDAEIDVIFDSIDNTTIEITKVNYITPNGEHLPFHFSTCGIYDKSTTCAEEVCDDCNKIGNEILSTLSPTNNCSLWRLIYPSDYDNCYSATFNWGDGSSDVALSNNNGGIHLKPLQQGCYTTTLTLIFGDGSVCTRTRTIDVCDAGCDTCDGCGNLNPDFTFNNTDNDTCADYFEMYNEGIDCDGMSYYWRIFDENNIQIFEWFEQSFDDTDFDFSDYAGTTCTIEFSLVAENPECTVTESTIWVVPESCGIICDDCNTVNNAIRDSLYINSTTVCTTASVTIPDIDGCYSGYINWGDSYFDLQSGQTMSHTYPTGTFQIEVMLTSLESGRRCRKWVSREFETNRCRSANDNLVIRPNPIKPNQELQFSGIDSKEITKIEILDMLGNPKQFTQRTPSSLFIGNLKPGIYFVKFYTAKGIEQKKLIIE